MIRSMTGFAHRDFDTPDFGGSVELKSYNNRYLDISISLPPYFSRFEPRVREYLGDRIARGKVEFSLRVRRIERPVRVQADLAAAAAIAEALAGVSRACGLDERPSLASILKFEGVISYEKDLDDEAAWPAILAQVEPCFAEFEGRRLAEGASTLGDIEKEIARLEGGLALVLSMVPEIERGIRTQFAARFAEFLPQVHDEGRILAETAVLLVKFGINEETARLGAHLASFRQIASGEESPARKLDFLCQEMNREVNTIGSKNMLLPVARAVVEMKDALENVREQLRNLE